MKFELIEDEFRENFIPVTESGCWLWLGCTSSGYGMIYGNGTSRRAHRISYELYRGSIPNGLQLDHLCRVRCCVNPDHLEPVDSRTNVLRGVGVTAKHAQQSQCIHGHPLDGIQYKRKKNGDLYIAGRCCLTCKRAWTRQWKLNRKQARTRGGGT